MEGDLVGGRRLEQQGNVHLLPRGFLFGTHLFRVNYRQHDLSRASLARVTKCSKVVVLSEESRFSHRQGIFQL